MPIVAILRSGKVEQVHVLNDSDVPTDIPLTEQDELAQAFQEALGVIPADAICKVSSIDGSFRGLYAGIGYTYDPIADVFVPPTQPGSDGSA